jgi:hypothetical protein
VTTEKAEVRGVDREGSTASSQAKTFSGNGQILRAQRYLASALHPLSCKANGFVLSGGVTDGAMCDCGLTAARMIIGELNGNV